MVIPWHLSANAVYRPLAVATIDAVALLRHAPLVLQLPDNEMPNQMITRRTVSRTLVTFGCVVLLVAATVHCLAYLKFSAPAVHSSNLPIALQSVFEVAFRRTSDQGIALSGLFSWSAHRRSSSARCSGLNASSAWRSSSERLSHSAIAKSARSQGGSRNSCVSVLDSMA